MPRSRWCILLYSLARAGCTGFITQGAGRVCSCCLSDGLSSACTLSRPGHFVQARHEVRSSHEKREPAAKRAGASQLVGFRVAQFTASKCITIATASHGRSYRYAWVESTCSQSVISAAMVLVLHCRVVRAKDDAPEAREVELQLRRSAQMEGAQRRQGIRSGPQPSTKSKSAQTALIQASEQRVGGLQHPTTQVAWPVHSSVHASAGTGPAARRTDR